MIPSLKKMWSAVVFLLAAPIALAQPPEKEPAPTTAGNLKQQMIALHKYHDQNARFPAAFRTSDDGKPLLSWRVAILPFLGEDKLYAEFRQNEPWDSEHNKPLIAKMPQVFRAPLSKADDGMTTYMGSGGATGVISRPPVQMQQIIDGTSNTLAVVEVGDKAAVIWTKPMEWVFKAHESIKEFAGLPGDQIFVALCDGSVLRLPKATPPVQLIRMFNREEGEIIEWPPGAGR